MTTTKCTAENCTLPKHQGYHLDADGGQWVGGPMNRDGSRPAAKPVHNHGAEDGPGLSCREYRTGEGQLQGECLGGLWSCRCGWTNTSDNRECVRCNHVEDCCSLYTLEPLDCCCHHGHEASQ